MSQTPSPLVARLAEILALRGWSQRELARRAGLSLSHIAVIKKQGGATVETLERVARAAGVEVEWLRTGQGPREAPRVEPVSPGGAALLLEALAAAWRSGAWSLEDLDAVRSLVTAGAAQLRDGEDPVEVMKVWLRVAALLRQEGRPVTIQSLAYRMASLGSEAIERAAEERTARLNAEAREELQALGASAPLEPVRPKKRP